jgi:hypothetical protein
MKCIIFYDTSAEHAGVQFNKWAAGKPLAKDMIIHTHATRVNDEDVSDFIIMVFWDEKMHPNW